MMINKNSINDRPRSKSSQSGITAALAISFHYQAKTLHHLDEAFEYQNDV
jgi:hypothetical protein